MRLGRDWCTPVIKVTEIEVGVGAPVLWEKISTRGVGRIIQCRRTSMTRSAASCKSHDMRATGITVLILIISLLPSVVSLKDCVEASGRFTAYTGVSKRKDSLLYHCESTVLGTSPRVKVWVGTYPTEELAALACDVLFYYTNRPSDKFNLEYSEDLILLHCKARSAFENLHNWDERTKFIKAEANRLIRLLPSLEQAPELRWEDVDIPPLVSVRRRAEEIAGTIVEEFRNQAEGRLQEFMAWLMHLSNAEAQLTPMEYSQAQHREACLGGDRILDVHHVASLVESLAWSGRYLWLALIAGSLPKIFQMFNVHAKTNAGDVEDASTFPNDAKLTDRKRCQSATKRQKVEHPPGIQLVSGRVKALLTAITFDVKNEAWQCTGYDLLSKTWKTLPRFSYLPDPDPELFKEYSVSGHGGLMCANVSKPPNKGEVVVFNPLTGKKRTLPPLLHPRNPVLMHILVDSATQSEYKVIVAGSSSSLDEHLSKKMEVFDSKTSKWEETCDLLGPAFGLNEYQTGVCVNGILYFISFLEGDDGYRKGVVAFDVENGKCLPSMTCPLPCPLSSGIVQLVENDGKVYLFYEHRQLYEHLQLYERCIDVLEISDPNAGAVTCHWRNVVRVENRGHRGLHVYPEFVCVGFGEGKLCIFNTLQADGVVYDTGSGMVSDVLEPPQPRSDSGSRKFFSLNPASFTLQLNSEMDPTPLMSVDDIQVGGTLIIHPFLQLP